MKTTMTNRLLRGVAAVIGACSLAFIPLAANAAPSLNWTDVSDQLTVRTNRPVWAMAYASPYWYYTDGQDLWNGGQVYRFDGQTQVNITTDVRNAGISRVDDIVTDGANVIFFQDVFRLDNQVSAVTYHSGSYRNITSTLRASLDSNEGVSSIVGRNGTWFMVSTRARLVKFNEDVSSYSRLTAPSDMKTLYSSESALLYSKQGRMDRENYLGATSGIDIAPTGNTFLLVVGRLYQTTSNSVAFFYRFDGTAFTKLSGPTLTGSAYTLDVDGIASNGTSALLMTGQYVDHGKAGKMYTFDGSNWNEISGYNWFCVDGSGACSSNSFSNTSNFSVVWTGSQWLITSGKNLYRVADNQLSTIGQVRDYFVTGASNGSGVTLLGGGVSDLSNTQPTYPLTAKLVKITEGTATTNGTTTYGGGQTAYSTYGPTLTTSGNPSDFRVGQGGTFNYHATASDTNGVDRIDLFANDAVIKTCYSDTCDFSTQYYTIRQVTRSIPLSARAWDRQGNPTQLANNDYLTVDINSTASANTQTTTNSTVNTTSQTAYGISSWTWVDPNQNYIRRDQNLTFNVGAQSSNGLKKVEIVINGATAKTCDLGGSTANQTCSFTLWGGTYPLGTTVSMNAKITDSKDASAWTGMTNLSVTDVSGSNTNTNTNTNTNSNYTTSVWDWLDPNSTTLAKNSSVTYHAAAQTSQGLSRIELWVNGVVRRTCDGGSSTGNVSCDITLYGSDYVAGTNVSVNARAVDTANRETWTTLHTLSVQADAGTTGTTTQTQTPTGANPTAHWSWSTPETSTIATNQTVLFTIGAWDADGIRSADFYVNGYVWKTCSFGDVKTGVECTVVLNGANWNAGGGVYVNAKLTDSLGNVTWTAFRQYAVVAAQSATSGTTSQSSNTTPSSNTTQNPPSNLPGTVSITTDHQNGFHAGDSVTYTATASDGNGIDRIDLFVEGVKVKTCSNTSTCSWTGGPYTDKNSLHYGANVVDKAGNLMWTGYLFISRI